MANVKVSAIAQNTSPDSNDLLYVVTSDGSLTSNRSTIADVMKNSTKVIYLGVSDDLQTAVNSASEGDTILLPSGTINIGSDIILNKGISIIGRGPLATILNAVSASTTFFRSSTDNIYIGGMKLVRANTNAGDGIYFDAPATSSFSGENIVFENLWMAWTCGVTGQAAGDGINVRNAGFNARNCLIQLSAVSPNAADQTRGMFHHVNSNNTRDTVCRVFDSRIEVSHGLGDGGVAEEARGFMSWNNGEASNFNTENYLQNVTIIVSANTNTQVEALEIQGTGVVCYVYNSFIQGGTSGSLSQNDVRVSNSANLYLYNTVLANNSFTEIEGWVNRRGIAGFQGIVIDSAQKPRSRSTPTSANANPGGIDLIGGEGADNIVTTTGSGGPGAAVSMILGDGGAANLANTNAVGGRGGDFDFVAGDGASLSVTSGNNTGGRGGNLILRAGVGGNASGGSSNKGGQGGSIYLITGTAGTGSASSGTDGALYLATDSNGTRTGRILIGTSSGLASGSGLCLNNTDLQFSLKSRTMTVSETLTSAVIDFANVIGLRGSNFVCVGSPNIEPSYRGKLLWLVHDATGTTQITLQDKINFPASGLDLGGYNMTMSAGLCMQLIYNDVYQTWEKIGDSRKKNFTLNTLSSTTGNVTSGEDDLWTYTLSGGQLGEQNQSLDYKAWGITGANGTGKRIIYYFGAEPVLDTGVLTENSAAWEITSTIVRSATTIQRIISRFATSSTSFVIYKKTTEDLTGAVVLKITGSSSTSSSNDVQQLGYRLHFYNNNG